MSKLLTTTAAALILAAATGAYAGDTPRNMGGNAAIQKGQSASTKAYGYNKQGDHYKAGTSYRDRNEWRHSNAYPGSRVPYGAKHGVVIKKGGSGISDASTEASTRQYGAYWE